MNGMQKQGPPRDRGLTEEEKARVVRLPPSVVDRIDKALLTTASRNWRKVAAVVSMVWRHMPDHPKDLPDVYYAQRVAKLVQRGLLESQGDLRRMFYSEVRTPRADDYQRI